VQVTDADCKYRGHIVGENVKFGWIMRICNNLFTNGKKNNCIHKLKMQSTSTYKTDF